MVGVLAGILLIIAAVFAAPAVLMLYGQNQYQAWEEQMYTVGPFAEQALWMSEDEQVVLISTEEPDGYVTVRVYYPEGDGFISNEVNMGPCRPQIHVWNL